MIAVIEALREEHRLLGAVLHAFRYLADRIEAGTAPPNLELLRAIAAYLDGFGERLHERKAKLLYARLAQREAGAAAVLERLGAESAQARRALTAVEHALLDLEVLGDRAHREFAACARRYVDLAQARMRIEESELLPLARRRLRPADWAALASQLDARRNPLFGVDPAEPYDRLFTRIVTLAPAPIGLGPPMNPEDA